MAVAAHYVTQQIAAQVIGLTDDALRERWRRGHFPAPDLEIFHRKLWKLRTLERFVAERQAEAAAMRARLDALNRGELAYLEDRSDGAS